MLIALDAMGGDLAPEEIVRGALMAADQLESQVALCGQEDKLRALIAGHPRADRMVIRPASEIVEMHDSPRTALRGKPDSSVARTVEMVCNQEAQACVSAGNSGGFMALCHTRLKTIPGVARPAIALFLPTKHGPKILLDAGANADCKPEYLVQFALMGSIYAEFALGIKSPRVGVLSIGTEAHKGNELTQATMPLMEKAPINFVGNVEGDQIFSDDDADVIVCDGFVGNVVLKVAEGVAGTLVDTLRTGIKRSAWAKVGVLFMRGPFKALRDLFDYGTYGGALLLGVNGICVVSHGKSDAFAIKNALLVAERAVKGRVVEHVRNTCRELFPETSVPA